MRVVGVPMLKAERISCSGPKLSDAQTRNFEAIKHKISVEGTDFDYPAPSRALLEVLPDLLDRLLEAEDSGYL